MSTLIASVAAFHPVKRTVEWFGEGGGALLSNVT